MMTYWAGARRVNASRPRIRGAYPNVHWRICRHRWYLRRPIAVVDGDSICRDNPQIIVIGGNIANAEALFFPE